MRHLVIKLELLAPGEVFCISRHLARSLVKHSELLLKIQNVNIVRQKFLFENGPSKQIMNKYLITRLKNTFNKTPHLRHEFLLPDFKKL